jgi:hypothetical protein
MQVLYEESLPGKKAKGLKKLSLGEKVHTGVGLDNLSVDKDGVVYGAGEPILRLSRFFSPITSPVWSPTAFPKVFPFLKTVSCAKEELDAALAKSPSMALKFVKNTGQSSFFGEKYRVETVSIQSSSLPLSVASTAESLILTTVVPKRRVANANSHFCSSRLGEGLFIHAW